MTTSELAQQDVVIVAIVRERGPLSAIDITKELIERGLCINRSAIAEVDRVRPRCEKLVAGGSLIIAATRKTIMPRKQKIYGLPA